MSTNINIPELTDQTFYNISLATYDYSSLETAYEKKLPIDIQTKKGTKEKWFIERVERDPHTGLDAFVFSQGKKVDGKWVRSETPKNVVVGFTGTDTSQLSTDLATSDGKHVVMGADPKVPTLYLKEKGTETLVKYSGSNGQEALLLSGQYELVKKDTAFEQSNKLVAEVKAEYKDSVISTTGHSLGEAEAEYAGIHNGVFSFGFNGPSIMNLYTDEMKERIYSGEFEKTAINLVDPFDAVGAGWSSEYERHGGTTYYTHNPMLDRQLRTDNVNSSWYFGLPGFVGGTIAYLADTAGEDGTHGINEQNFKFDENGNAINTDPSQNTPYLYNRNKEEFVYGTPLSSDGSGSIRLDLASVREMAEMIGQKVEEMKAFEMKVVQFEQVHNEAVQNVISHFDAKLSGEFHLLSQADVRETIRDLSLSQSGGLPMFYEDADLDRALSSLQKTMRDLESIQSLFESMAVQFEDRDRLLASWLSQ
ncbi:hypothetical protein [Metabacillus indicus]|uniref:hypothetical protein n=1 Tax=Metabacillus indicus TaxID=246786 RepID=UPI003CF0D3CF